MVPNKKAGALIKVSERLITLIYFLIVLWELILFTRLFVIVSEFNLTAPIIRGFMYVTNFVTFPVNDLLTNIVETTLLREIYATGISMLLSLFISVGIALILKLIIKRNQK